MRYAILSMLSKYTMSSQDILSDNAPASPEQKTIAPDESDLSKISPPVSVSSVDPQSNELKPFGKSESKSLGFAGRAKDMFSGKKLVSTIVALGFIFTWSERVLTSFRTQFSLYRDVPKIITGKNTGGDGRFRQLRTAGENIKNLFVTGSNNSFINKYSTGEKLEALATIGGTAYNAWFLLSSREGDIPEGDTMLERTKNIFKNPQHHVAQLVNIFTSITYTVLGTGRIMIGVNNLSHDAHGNKIGFSPNKALRSTDGMTKIEKLTPLITGLALITAAPLTTYSLLKMKKPTQESEMHKEEMEVITKSETGGDIVVLNEKEHPEIKTFAKSQSKMQASNQESSLKQLLSMFMPKHLKNMAEYAVEKDPIGLTCRILSFALDIGFFGVGLARLKLIESGQYAHKYGAVASPEWDNARALAKQTRNVGVLGFALTSLYTMYVYDALMVAQKKAQETMKANSDAPQMAR